MVVGRPDGHGSHEVRGAGSVQARAGTEATAADRGRSGSGSVGIKFTGSSRLVEIAWARGLFQMRLFVAELYLRMFWITQGEHDRSVRSAKRHFEASMIRLGVSPGPTR